MPEESPAINREGLAVDKHPMVLLSAVPWSPKSGLEWWMESLSIIVRITRGRNNNKYLIEVYFTYLILWLGCISANWTQNIGNYWRYSD